MSARFSISTPSAIEIIDSGGCVVDIGQISAPTRRFLQQRVRQGVYVRFDYRGYPVAKNGYCLPQFAQRCAGMAP